MALKSEGNRKDSRRRRRLFPSKKFVWTTLILVLLIAVGVLAYGYVQTKQDLQNAQNPTKAAKAEAQDIVKQVGKYLDLPPKERPTVATVSDKSKLQDQTFFEKAQNGDKVLVYTKAQRAVLYRPSTKKVIEYAPIKLDGTASTSASKATPTTTQPDAASSLTAPAGGPSQ